MARVKLTQVRSGIGQSERHRGTLRALGLGKIGRSHEHEEGPALAGQHLGVVATQPLRVEDSQMPRTKSPYLAEFRARMIDLARSGRTVRSLSKEFGVTETTIRRGLTAPGKRSPLWVKPISIWRTFRLSAPGSTYRRTFRKSCWLERIRVRVPATWSKRSWIWNGRARLHGTPESFM